MCLSQTLPVLQLGLGAAEWLAFAGVTMLYAAALARQALGGRLAQARAA